MRLRVLLALSLALFAAACESRIVTSFMPADYGLEYGFLVVFDTLGAPTRFTQPFGIENGRLTFGERPSIVLRSDEASFILVGLDRAKLASAFPGFEPQRARELAVSMGAPPLTARLDSRDRLRPTLAGALPDGALYLTADVEQGGGAMLTEVDPARRAIRDLITLHVPVDPEHCRIPGESKLETFNGIDNIFTGLPVATGTIAILNPNIHVLQWFDDERLIGLTPSHVALVRQGQPLDRSRAIVRLTPRVGNLREGIIAIVMALDRTPRGADPNKLRLVVAGPETDAGISHVWDLLASPDGLELVSTSTLAAHATGLAITPDGTVWMGTKGARMWSRPLDATEFSPGDQLERYYFEDPRDELHVVATGDEDHPLFASTKGRLQLYDASSRRWEFEMPLQDGLASAEPLDFEALGVGRSASGELELWAGAQRGHIYRKLGNAGWQEKKLDLPPRFLECATLDDQTGAVVYQGQYMGLALSDGYVHVSATDCNALLQIRRSDLCVSVLERANAPIGPTSDDLRALAVREGIVANAGFDGLMLNARWP